MNHVLNTNPAPCVVGSFSSLEADTEDGNFKEEHSVSGPARE